MNEFDELFDKERPVPPTKPQRDGIEDFHFQANLQRKNGILLMIYIGVLLLFSVITSIYYRIQYPDSEAILAGIVMVDDFQIDVQPNEDTVYPYKIKMTGGMWNNSGIDLPRIWFTVKFFDADDNSLGTYSGYAEKNANGETFVIDQSVLTDFVPDTFAFSYGYDESSMFYTVIGFLPVFITGIAFLLVDRQAFAYDFQRFRKNWKNLLGQIATGFLMVYAALLIAQLILIELGVQETSQNELTIQGLFQANPIQLVLLFLLLCVFTPITEEVVFRKILYNYVQPRTGHVVAIIISGAVFGLMHVIAYQDFIQSIPYIFMGLIFGLIYYRSKKNIFVTMGVHFLNNLMSFVIYALMAYGISIF